MALQQAAFITPAYLKQYYSGYIDSNVDDSALDSFILVAQDVRIQSALGYDLYTKYQNDINSYGGATGSQYIYLMSNYIEPCLALWTLFEAMPALNFHLTNKSLTKNSSQYGEPSSRNEVEYYRTQLSNNAQFYQQRIREYIINNTSSFPEYFMQTGIERIAPKSNAYFAGMYMPDGPLLGGSGYWGGSRSTRCCNDRYFRLNW